MTEQPIPARPPDNTIDPSIQVQGNYRAAWSGAGRPFTGKLSLREAVDWGLAFNLGTKGITFAMQQAQGQARVARSALMPNLNGGLTETVTQVDLAAEGLRISVNIPGFHFPTIVGPFNYFDLRARLSQTVADFAALNNYRSSVETFHADEFLAKDAKDLVVLAVGGAYLQAVAAKARVEAQRAQLATANALYDQTNQQRLAGLLARIDADHSQIQALSQQQRMISLENDFAKQKINLARLIGLPPNSNFELTDDVPLAGLRSTRCESQNCTAGSRFQRVEQSCSRPRKHLKTNLLGPRLHRCHWGCPGHCYSQAASKVACRNKGRLGLNLGHKHSLRYGIKDRCDRQSPFRGFCRGLDC